MEKWPSGTIGQGHKWTMPGNLPTSGFPASQALCVTLLTGNSWKRMSLSLWFVGRAQNRNYPTTLMPGRRGW